MQSRPKDSTEKIIIPSQQKNVEGITISFRTMPNDLEFLSTKYGPMPSAAAGSAQGGKESSPTPAAAKNVIYPGIEEIAMTPPPSAEMRLREEPVISTAINGEGQTAEDDKFITKLGQQDMKPEKELEEIKIKRERKLQEEEIRKQIKTLYKEALYLYKHKLYKEAQEKLNGLLELNPGHWRAKWTLKRVAKKAVRQQAARSQTPKELPKADLNATPTTPQSEDKEKEKIKELLSEETKYAQRIERELAQSREEKLAAEEEAKKIREALANIGAKTQEQAKGEFDEQLRREEEQIKNLQDEKNKTEKDLAELKSSNLALEEQITRTKELLLAREQEAELKAKQESERLAQEEIKRQEELSALEKEISEKEILRQSPAPQNYELYSNIPAQQPSYSEPAGIPEQTAPMKENPSLLSFEHISEKLRSLSAIKKISASLIFIAFISVAAIYLIGLWKNSANQPETADNPDASEQVLPAPLFSIETSETIIMQTGQKKNLLEEINNLTAKNFPAGNFTRILAQTINSQTQEKSYADLPDLIDSLRISFPSEILSNISNSYTLFLYSQKQAPAGPFLEGLGKNKMGIVISVKDNSNLNQLFSDWEKTMPDDLDALFLGKKISFLANYNFQDILYKNNAIRSLNLPNEFSSMNYSFYNNKILITTSLESMQSLIDKMTPAQ
jgi:hypothetical protein